MTKRSHTTVLLDPVALAHSHIQRALIDLREPTTPAELRHAVKTLKRATAELHKASGLLDALTRLESCPDLNLESLEDETLDALSQARRAIAEATGKGIA